MTKGCGGKHISPFFHRSIYIKINLIINTTDNYIQMETTLFTDCFYLQAAKDKTEFFYNYNELCLWGLTLPVQKQLFW